MDFLRAHEAGSDTGCCSESDPWSRGGAHGGGRQGGPTPCTAEALHTGPWSSLAEDRTQTWQPLPRAHQATAPGPPPAPSQRYGKDGGAARHPHPMPHPRLRKGWSPAGCRSIVLQCQSGVESHPPGLTCALFLGAVWAKNQAGERPVCAAPAGLTVLPMARLRGPVPPPPCHGSPPQSQGLWGSTELTGGSSPLPRGPQQGQRRGKRTGRL